MRKQKKIRGSIVSALLLVLFYLIFFSAPTIKEPVVLPVWTLNLNEAPLEVGSPPPGQVLTAFKLQDRFGYVDWEGSLYYRGYVQYDVALSKQGFINFSSLQTQEQSLVFFNSRGEFIRSYQLTGYPILSRDGSRFFILSTDGLGVKEVDSDGNLLWRLDSPSVITTLDISTDLLALGFSNGLFKLIDKSGAVVYTYQHTGSRIPIILGCALTEKGEQAGIVAGLDPQVYIHLKQDGGIYQSTQLAQLESPFRREVFLQFSRDGQSLFMEDSRGLLHYDFTLKKSTLLAFPGGFHFKTLAEDGAFFALLSTTGNQFCLQVFERNNFLINQDFFTAADAAVFIKDNQLILGQDDHLLKFNIVEM